MKHGGAERVEAQAVTVLAVLGRALDDDRLTPLPAQLRRQGEARHAAADDQRPHHSVPLSQRS